MILIKKLKFNAWLILAALTIAFSFNACRDDQFDEPPITGEDPGLTVNMTIDSIKSIYSSQLRNYSAIPYIKIDNDWTIKATVIGDDKSGNLCDWTGDEAVKLVVKLKGLTVQPLAGVVRLFSHLICIRIICGGGRGLFR